MPEEKLPKDVEFELAGLLARELEFMLKVEQMKANLHFLPGFSLLKVFKAIDEQNTQFVDENTLRRFFKKMGHPPDKNELVAILRRFDLDGDAKLSFEEFCEAFDKI